MLQEHNLQIKIKKNIFFLSKIIFNNNNIYYNVNKFSLHIIFIKYDCF